MVSVNYLFPSDSLTRIISKCLREIRDLSVVFGLIHMSFCTIKRPAMIFGNANRLLENGENSAKTFKKTFTSNPRKNVIARDLKLTYRALKVLYIT